MDRKREKLTKWYFMISPSVKRRVEAVAAKDNRSPGYMIREYIERGLKRDEKKPVNKKK